jgi:hypothetical protein
VKAFARQHHSQRTFTNMPITQYPYPFHNASTKRGPTQPEVPQWCHQRSPARLQPQPLHQGGVGPASPSKERREAPTTSPLYPSPACSTPHDLERPELAAPNRSRRPHLTHWLTADAVRGGHGHRQRHPAKPPLPMCVVPVVVVAAFPHPPSSLSPQRATHTT